MTFFASMNGSTKAVIPTGRSARRMASDTAANDPMTPVMGRPRKTVSHCPRPEYRIRVRVWPSAIIVGSLLEIWSAMSPSDPLIDPETSTRRT